MKPILLVLMAMFAIHPSFSQKNKSNKSSANNNIRQTTYTCPMHPEVIADKPGKCPKCNMDLVASKEGQKKKDAMMTYSCTRHPEVISDHPGVCPL